MAEPKFVDGMRVSRNANAPEYVTCKLGIKVDEFRNWLAKNQQGEWINIDIKLSKKGSYYAELDTYNRADELRKAQEPTDRLTGKDAEEVIAAREDYNARVEALQQKEDEMDVSNIPF
jgi:hypothetical protein